MEGIYKSPSITQCNYNACVDYDILCVLSPWGVSANSGMIVYTLKIERQKSQPRLHSLKSLLTHSSLYKHYT